MRLNISILSGGISAERDISFQTSKQIFSNLDKNKYNVTILEIPEDKKDTRWVSALISDPPDIVLSALHGGAGENGGVQGLLECLSIPYVGSKVLASALGMDKNMSKVIMRANHIPVPDDVFIKTDDETSHFSEKISELGFPLIVKPNRGGSSIGISIIEKPEELPSAVKLVKSMGDDILIEKYIKGREVTCGVFETGNGLQVLSVLDIETNDAFFDYSAKYENAAARVDFSTLPVFLQTMIQEVAKKGFTVLGCRGYGRVDLIVFEEQIFVLEINTLPGLTSHSLIPRAVKGANMSFSEFLDKLIEFELREVNPS